MDGDQNLIKKYRDIVQKSRSDYQEAGQRNLETALQESLRDYEVKDGQSKNSDDDEEKKAIEESKQSYEQNLDDEELLKVAMQESLQHTPGFQLNQDIEDGMLKAALQNSAAEFGQGGFDTNPILIEVVSMGFTQEQAREGLQLYGNDKEAVINFLLAQLS
jgi:hypothetical protein